VRERERENRKEGEEGGGGTNIRQKQPSAGTKIVFYNIEPGVV